MNAIEIKKLTKTYETFSLSNISFNIPTGMIVGLVGENGAGKSTLIKLIMHAIKADNGNVKVLGIENTVKEFEKVKQEIGVVLDDAHFPEMLNAQNINAVMKQTYEKWDEKIYNEFIERFRIPVQQKFKDYSKGMKMKLSIAVALSHSPKILILDEATSGLDPMVRNELLDVFHEFTRNEENSILISSHIISDLEKICDYIAFLHKGTLVINEEKDILLEKYRVLKLTEEELQDIPKQAIVAKRQTRYGYEVLVKKEKVNSCFTFENTTLEEIVLFMAKEGV